MKRAFNNHAKYPNGRSSHNKFQNFRLLQLSSPFQLTYAFLDHIQAAPQIWQHNTPSKINTNGSNPTNMRYANENPIFTYEDLANATQGFSNTNLLGQCGFGYIHKGILPTGEMVVIKQLKIGSGQGEREFQAEVAIISRVHHKHVVSLVGYCTSGL